MKRWALYVVFGLWAIYFTYTVHLSHRKPNKAIELVEITPEVAPEVTPEVVEGNEIEFPPTLILKEPEPKNTQLYLLKPKSIQTPDGITGIRIGTKVTWIGLHRYKTANGEEFLATDDEVTDDVSKIPQITEYIPLPEQKILSEEKAQDTQTKPNNTAKSQSNKVQPNNPLNKPSYNKKDFGVRDSNGIRQPFSR